MGCVSVSLADSADREGLSKWAIFMLLITKETVKYLLSAACGSICVWLGVDSAGIHLSSAALAG